MAKKKSKRTPTGKRAEVKDPAKKKSRPKVSKKRATKKQGSARAPANQMEVIGMQQLVESQPSLAAVIDTGNDSLVHWFTVYLKSMVDPDSNTFRAKRDDIQRFLAYFHDKHRSFECDKWTPSITKGYIKWLSKQRAKNQRGEETKRKLAPSTCARNLDTLRTAARWIHRQREFVAGLPFGKRDVIKVDEPDWQGLTGTDIIRLCSAAEQLVAIQTKSMQRPRRNYALFLVGINTGLRVEEIASLELSQYQGKHLKDVYRTKNKKYQTFFLDAPVREILDAYIEVERGNAAGALFASKTGEMLDQKAIYQALKSIAQQANSTLPKDEQIKIHPHLMRHTFLRRVTDKSDIRAARRVSGLNSDKYLWRYVQVTEEEAQKTLTGLHDD
jgi:integrase/recombinase XerD